MTEGRKSSRSSVTYFLSRCLAGELSVVIVTWPTRKCQRQHLIASGRSNIRNLCKRRNSSGLSPIQVAATCHYAEKENNEGKNNKASQEYKSKRWQSMGLYTAWEMSTEQKGKRMATFPQSNSCCRSEYCWAHDNYSFWYWIQAGSGKAHLMPWNLPSPLYRLEERHDVSSTV